jgi:UV DNA damage endonuclease
MNPSLIAQLEQEWAVHKYAILEKDPATYQKIRTLLKIKESPDAVLFHALIKEAYHQTDHEGRQNNAVLHVWGYFKSIATPEEKVAFENKHNLWLSHQESLNNLKWELYTLAVKYNQVYLLNSTYFDRVK